MSDIWHKAGFHEAIDDKLKVSKDGKWVYWTMYGWNIAGEDAHDIGCEWAYLDDLLAFETELEQSQTCCTEWEKQALDYKVENIALSGDLERTRKALEIAVDALKRLEKELYFNNAKQTGHIADSVMSIPSIALEQITALEQKDK